MKKNYPRYIGETVRIKCDTCGRVCSSTIIDKKNNVKNTTCRRCKKTEICKDKA